jgi:hypothetical protein
VIPGFGRCPLKFCSAVPRYTEECHKSTADPKPTPKVPALTPTNWLNGWGVGGMRKSTTGRRAYGSLDWQSVLDVTESNEICSLEQGIDNLDLDISRNRKRLKTIVELLIDTPSESLKEDLLETEQKLKAQTTQKAELEKTLNTAKVRHSNLVSTDVVYYQLAGLKDLESHARLREEIRRKVARIDVTFGVEIIVAGASEVNGVRTRYWS